MSDTFTFSDLDQVLGDQAKADVRCPICAPNRKPEHQGIKSLRIWRLDNGAISASCVHCGRKAVIYPGRDRRLTAAEVNETRRTVEATRRQDEARRQARIRSARTLWGEADAIIGSQSEKYLVGRGLRLPGNVNQVLRHHPRCPWGERKRRAVMLAAFRLIDPEKPPNPADLPPVMGVSRIAGRGHQNKLMLGATKGSAVMLGRWTPGATLNIAEGIETAIGVAMGLPPGAPVWALGGDIAIRDFPILTWCDDLAIWGDHDEAGIAAAEACRDRWQRAGISCRIILPTREGADHADVP